MTGTATDWLAKAHDDLRTVELLDMFDKYPCVVAAFHCQQAVEKSLKVFLTARQVEFLYRHDLGYLLDLCKSIDPACAALEPLTVLLLRQMYVVCLMSTQETPVWPTLRRAIGPAISRHTTKTVRALEPHIVGLTPYAVEIRYPADLPLTPSREDVEQFYRQAQAVYEFVVSRCTV